MAAFQARLKHVLRDGNLTVADLARWFDRPDPTVRGWVHQGIGLGGTPADARQLLDCLADLEARVGRRKGFPVPRLSPGRRIEYLANLKEPV